MSRVCTWYHASSVTQSVLLADIVADELLVGGVVKGGSQVAGGEHLALACKAPRKLVNKAASSAMLRLPLTAWPACQ